MSLRFRRSIRLLPGIHVNLGLHGAGSADSGGCLLLVLILVFLTLIEIVEKR